MRKKSKEMKKYRWEKEERKIVCWFNVKNLSDFRSTAIVRSNVDDDLETGAATLNPLKTER